MSFLSYTIAIHFGPEILCARLCSKINAGVLKGRISSLLGDEPLLGYLCSGNGSAYRGELLKEPFCPNGKSVNTYGDSSAGKTLRRYGEWV